MENGLSLRDKILLENLMIKVNDSHVPDCTKEWALNNLLCVKQDMIDAEAYEACQDFYKLEQQHGLNIPFKVLEPRL